MGRIRDKIKERRQGENGTWEDAYDGSDETLLYLPDAKACYWRYGWDRKTKDTTGFIFTAKMPNARYFSYNVYDETTKDSVGSFADYKIITNDGRPNPFTGDTSGEKNPEYTVVVLPKGTKTDEKNVLFYDPSITKISVFLRYYVREVDETGGVPLPEIHRYDPSTKEISNCPKSTEVPKLSAEEAKKYLVPVIKKFADNLVHNTSEVARNISERVKAGDRFDVKKVVVTELMHNVFDYYGGPNKLCHSYRFQVSGTYPNSDNVYLGLPAIRDNGDQVLVVRFKTPSHPKCKEQYNKTDVRYFSLGQGDEFSYNKFSTYDDETVGNPDGFTYIVIGDKGKGLEEKAKELNGNFNKWSVDQKMLLIFRHMLPHEGFDNGIHKVKSFVKEDPVQLKGQEGHAQIGDYAIVGRMINVSDFLSGGYPSWEDDRFE